MLAQIFGTLTLQSQFPIASEIIVRDFVDIEMDVEGWYAIGHHQPAAFFSAVAKHEPLNKLKRNHIEHLWAVFSGKDFELFDEAVPEAKPVTVIRMF